MKSNLFLSPASHEATARGVPKSSAPPLACDEALEDYLDRVCAPLVELMPYPARQEMRAELRAHLEARAEVYEEEGDSPGAALHRALRQCGEPALIARHWREEWERSQPAAGTTRPAARMALRVFGLAFGITWPTLSYLATSPSPGPALRLVVAALLLGAPITLGAVVGSRRPRRAMLGTFWALSALLGPITAVAACAALTTGMSPASPLEAALAHIIWLPLGPLGAGLASSVHDSSALRAAWRRVWSD
jgi:hypothetical protein